MVWFAAQFGDPVFPKQKEVPNSPLSSALGLAKMDALCPPPSLQPLLACSWTWARCLCTGRRYPTDMWVAGSAPDRESGLMSLTMAVVEVEAVVMASVATKHHFSTPCPTLTGIIQRTSARLTSWTLTPQLHHPDFSGVRNIQEGQMY